MDEFEVKAGLILDEYSNSSIGEKGLVERIATALRAARNHALEDAAKTVGQCSTMSRQGMDDLAAHIRSIKSPGEVPNA